MKDECENKAHDRDNEQTPLAIETHDLSEALNDCIKLKANDLQIKNHPAILAFSDPKLSEYHFAGDGSKVNGADVSNRFVLSAYGLDGTLCNLAYIEPKQPTVFAYQNHHQRGFYCFNNPLAEKFVYVVIDMVAAFRIAAAGLACILIAPVAAQNGAAVVFNTNYQYQLKTALLALQHHGLKVYCPVPCHELNDYTRALSGLAVTILALEAGIGVFDDANGLKKYLGALKARSESKVLAGLDAASVTSKNRIPKGHLAEPMAYGGNDARFEILPHLSLIHI